MGSTTSGRRAIFCWLLCCTTAFAAKEGTVILHGGGAVPSSVRDRFFELAGGKNSKLLVIPTADSLTPDDDGRLETWQNREPASVALLHADSREQAETETFAEPLRRATGVWISGGRQSVLASTYLRIPVERELSALLKRGGVIAGTSAGAAIQSKVMIVRGEAREGFDFVPNAVIDQHFIARNRQERLWHVLSAHPQRFGIGVDESTAAIICGNRLTVLGKSTVMVFVPAYGNQPRRVEQLKTGDQLDLKPIRAEVTERK